MDKNTCYIWIVALICATAIIIDGEGSVLISACDRLIDALWFLTILITVFFALASREDTQTSEGQEDKNDISH